GLAEPEDCLSREETRLGCGLGGIFQYTPLICRPLLLETREQRKVRHWFNPRKYEAYHQDGRRWSFRYRIVEDRSLLFPQQKSSRAQLWPVPVPLCPHPGT